MSGEFLGSVHVVRFVGVQQSLWHHSGTFGVLWGSTQMCGQTCGLWCMLFGIPIDRSVDACADLRVCGQTFVVVFMDASGFLFWSKACRLL